LALLLAGAAQVKATAGILLVVIPSAAAIMRCVVAAVRARGGSRRGALLGLCALAAAGLGLTPAAGVGEWGWAGGPLYPELHRVFKERPWVAGSADLYDHGYKGFQLWHPRRSVGGVLETLRVLVTFSFVPNDWSEFHGMTPVFGSLFTLLIPALLFV